MFDILAQLVGGLFAASPALLLTALILSTSLLEIVLKVCRFHLAKDISFLKRQFIRRVKAGTASVEAAAHRLKIENVKLKIECELLWHHTQRRQNAETSEKDSTVGAHEIQNDYPQNKP